MNIRTTLVLVVLLAVVAGFFYFFERGRATTRQIEEARNASNGDYTAAFTGIDFTDTDHATVTITRPEGSVTFEGAGETWKQTAPVQFPLESWSAKQIVRDVRDLQYSEKFPHTGDKSDPSHKGPYPKDVGLDSPLATIKVEVSPGSSSDKSAQPPKGNRWTHTVKLGRQSLGGRVYAMIDEDPSIYVVLGNIYSSVVEHNIHDWRRKSLPIPGETASKSLTLNNQGQALSLEKTDGAWLLDQPESGRASDEKIKAAFNALTSLYVNEFVADNPSSLALYGLDHPSMTVEIQTTTPVKEGDASKVDEVTRLLIGSPTDLKADKVFASLVTGNRGGKPEVVFSIDKSVLDKLSLNVKDWRDPRITVMQPRGLNSLGVLVHEGPVYSLTKTVEGWGFDAEGPGFTADQGLVGDLATSLTNVKAEDYQPDFKPAGPEAAVVKLGMIGKPGADVLRIYPRDGGTYTVLRNDESVGYVVKASDLAGVFEPVLKLRNRTVVDTGGAKIDRVSIANMQDDTFTFTRQFKTQGEGEKATTEPGDWSLLNMDSYDHEALDNLLARIAPLRAESWLESVHQPLNFIHVTLHEHDGRTIDLTVDPTSRHATAAVDGKDIGFFTVSQTVVESLTAEFRDRVILKITPSDIASISLDQNGKSIIVTQDAEGVYKVSNADADSASCGAIYSSLSGLTVEHYLSSPPADFKPARVFTITMKDSSTHQVALSGTTVNVDDRYATISDSRSKRLSGDVVKSGDAVQSDPVE
ncbi:MAG: DUF4340 domain-containing protein [Phycisphaera sp.]|nr:DUF4340 domain-containing protein [Phycisphaera sp.]